MALERSFQAYPWSKHLFEALLNTTTDTAAPLISALGNICLLNPPKYQRRAYIPILHLAVFCLSPEEIAAATVTFDPATTNPILVDGKISVRNSNPHYVDFSGKGALMLWEETSKFEEWTWKGYAGVPRDWTELHYHSFWGTHVEDLGVLEWQTGHEFKTRREMGNFARKPTDQSQKKKFNIARISHIYYSKMVSGNVTGTSIGRRQQLTVNPVRAGKRKITYSQDVLDSLGSSIDTRTLGTDIISLTHKITEDYKVLLSKKKAGAEEVWGNTSWYRLRTGDNGEYRYEEEKEARAESSGKYFL